MDVKNEVQKTENKRREPKLWEASIPIVAMIILLCGGYGIMQLPVEMLLIAAAFIASLIALRLGYNWKDIEGAIIQAITKGMPAQMIIIIVGVMIASWIASGTIPMLIDYGLRIVSPTYFLVTASVVCAFISLITGTPYGTAGTLGVAFMGIGHGLGIPLAPVAGAIVAGCYIGDKLSPFSAAANLASAAVKGYVMDTSQHLLWTTVPAFAIALIVYWIVGSHYAIANTGADRIALIQNTLQANFHYHWLMLLPPLIILFLTFRRKPAVPVMLLSSAVALILAMVFQGKSLAAVMEYCVTGYKSTTGVALVDQLLTRGGLMGMMGITLITFCAFAFAGVIQKAGILDLILKKIMNFTKSTGMLIASATASSLATGLLTGNSYLSVLLPGELFAPAFKEKKLAAKNLARITQEAHIIVPITPWAIAGVYMSGTLGVSTWDYALWAVSNYVGFILVVIYGFIGFKTAPLKREDETQPGS
jgi:NhaC family Na+:H+ antiporter